MSDYQPSESKWWWKDYDYDHREHSYSTGSGSRSWMSKIGGYDSDWWKPKKKDVREVYQELLDQLQTSANLIGDFSRGSVEVHWSDGQNVNEIKPGNQQIYLSPDNLLTTTSGGSEISEEVLDSMTGKVYLASTLRETVDPKSYEKAKVARSVVKAKRNKMLSHYPCPCSSGKAFGSCCERKATDHDATVQSNALTIWEAMETAIARKQIVEDWSGFGPYIASDAERSSASKQEIQDYIDNSVDNPTADAASVAIAWNLLNANDPVKIPDVYDECVDSACEILENEIEAQNRFDSCRDISDRIYKIIKKKKEEEGEGEGEGDSNDDSDEGDSPSNDGKPGLCDGSLLGDKVKNKTDETLAEQQAGDPTDDGDKGEIRATPPDSLCDIGAKYELIKMKPESYHLSEYREVVGSHRSEIASIRSSLQFRSNIAKMQSFGHRSGDIDDNSLFKIKMNDDRVMTKTDVISSKKIAICLLVDESGSMGCGNRVRDARNVSIILAESLKGMDGIEVSIYGHSAEENYSEENYSKNGVVLREYYSPRQKNPAACMQIDARSQNHDSYAILHTANIFNKDFSDYDRKIMFVVSDGEPAGSNYGGKPARDHMLKVSQSCEKSRVEVYGIGVDNAYSESMGKSMYGDNRFVILKDVKGSLGIMSRFIRQIAMK